MAPSYSTQRFAARNRKMPQAEEKSVEASDGPVRPSAFTKLSAARARKSWRAEAVLLIWSGIAAVSLISLSVLGERCFGTYSARTRRTGF